MTLLVPTGMGYLDGLFRIAGSGDIFITTSRLFTQTADKTVTNTITETTIIGTGVGSLTVPKEIWIAGANLRIEIGGIYSTPAVVASSATLKIKLGTTIIASGTTTALATGATNLRFNGIGNIICRTAGASGVLSIDAGINYNVAGSDIPISDPLNNGGSTITGIDLTGNLVFDLTITWDTATTTRSATSTQVLITPSW